ncbi:penicillin-binding protein activator [Alteromonas gilva]|uniref:Penicillin-binding protein activator n=1 Tax=Alteromonas gilva TaxID=2987522 RepID=A0ABT5L829_9ALTE|nr:penicillin-binding protein activator [Alteromonas gilva]MDC8832566.1 penicillin-binding protein activator [Alteromonas gilva]
MTRKQVWLLVGTFTLLLLGGCGSTPKTSSLPVATPTQNQETTSQQAPSLQPEQWLAEAQRVWQQGEERDARNDLLLKAAQSYAELGQLAQARQILFTIRGSLGTPSQRNRYNLLLAELYQNDNKVGSQQRLRLLQSVTTTEPDLQQQQYRLMALEYARLGEWIEAANALLMSDPNAPDNIAQAWAWVNQSSPEQLASSAQHSQLAPYVSLRQLILDYGFNPDQLSQQLAQFQQVFRGHPLVANWPDNLNHPEKLEPGKRDNIVVMLPLSGRLQVTGMAIKEGILAAYFGETSRIKDVAPAQLQFIDTNTATTAELIEKSSSADWIIGPLLKENVDALLSQLPASAQILTLNRPSVINTALAASSDKPVLGDSPKQPVELLPARYSSQIYYALAPEDEARQLANRVFLQGHRSPILVASTNSLHQRMQDAFMEQWQRLTSGLAARQHSAPTKVTYSDNASLRDGILEALDVAQSKDRIKEIQSFANETLYDLPRNRRDIDAIVVFTSPEQTELVNPVIEASLSPFSGVRVPVFATSRSVDYAQSRNQWRDLENLHFLDMPWVLPDNPAPALAQQAEQLWPQRPTSLQRLFAFGVDAYNLIPRLNSLVGLPQLEYQGLTGSLSVNKDKEIVRRLPEAVVSQERITLIAE